MKRDQNGNIIYKVDEHGSVSTIPFLGGNEIEVLEYGGAIGINKKGYEYGLRFIQYKGDFNKTSENTGKVTTGDASEYLLDLSGNQRWGGLVLSANIFYHKEFGFDVFPKIAYGKKFEPFYYDVSFTSTKKYPSFFEKYFSTSDVRANPTLEPQVNLCATLKFGGKHDLNTNQFSWQLAPFFNKAYGKFYSHTYFKVGTETGKVDYKQYENLDEAYWTGCDIIFKYIHGDRTGFDGCFTIRKTRDEVHKSSFAYYAPYKFNGYFFFKPIKPLNLQLWYTYYSDRYADQAETYKMLWYHYLDFKTTYHMKKNTMLFLEVKNLTDFDYYVYRGYPRNCRQ